ncbi:F-box domain-containing protein [Heracleum sosnowskyi]|uniref:F-box domain-containing protein n=1 Tax=Heracleum sosnowskyi TaxID=360622 RepID=A0AAD8IKC5_9APIA|nr:F-box domain-containing protein [Heracleum sosnowskyi]
MKEKKARFSNEQKGGEDRVSSLPDDLIHHIMSFSDVSSAVQTSALSKRWKLIWTTLPFLNFIKDEYMSTPIGIKFVHEFFRYRNYESQVSKLHLAFQSPPPFWVDWFTTYAISHNVEELNFDIASFGTSDDAIELSTFSSKTIKELTLRLNFAELVESDRWDLPVLTTLRLIQRAPYHSWMAYKLLDSCLICLPCLRTLLLDGFELPNSFSIPSLTSLHLARCGLPQKVWDLPSLITLTLEDVSFNESITFLSTLFNLRNLILFFRTRTMMDCYIVSPQLVNLEINAPMSTTGHSSNITVLAPKIRNFSSVGIFSITFGVTKLENVNINLQGSTALDASPKKLERYYGHVVYMFPGLGNARILTLDLATIEALSSISKLLSLFPSPFYNLKYVKVPQGYKESCIPTCLKQYLLDRSPNATIVTTLPQQDELIPQNLVAEKLLAASVARTGHDQASSSKAPDDFGLWQGHEVNLEFLGLLDCISKKYPETFEYFTTHNKKLCTMKLNMLCTMVKNFTKTSLTEVDTEMITEYRAQFADLQRSFNVQWLVNHLNSIEQLQCSQPLVDKLHALHSHISDARSKLQDSQTLGMRTMTEIYRNVGTMGTSLVVGNIGECLFSSP